MFENRMLLFISDRHPPAVWTNSARRYNWHLLHEAALLRALGAYVMLMPDIIVVDKDSAVGAEALDHIEDVLHTPPQLKQVVIELCDCQCIYRKGEVVRACLPVHTRLEATLEEAASLLRVG